MNIALSIYIFFLVVVALAACLMLWWSWRALERDNQLYSIRIIDDDDLGNGRIYVFEGCITVILIALRFSLLASSVAEILLWKYIPREVAMAQLGSLWLVTLAIVWVGKDALKALNTLPKDLRKEAE